VTEMEHHSNLVPWQLLAQRTGAEFKWIPLDDEGRLDADAIERVITERTKVVAFVHQSNALGTVNPVPRIVARARAVGALTVVDAAQSAPHRPLDVQALGADFVGFTVGPLRAARRAAGVSGRRRNDRDRGHDRHHLRQAPAPF